MATERTRVKLPEGFDPKKHTAALTQLVNQKQEGGGFELDNIGDGYAHFSRQAVVTEISARGAGAGRAESFEVRLARGTKPADGARVAAKLEDQYEGFRVTRFDPFLFTAELTRLTPATARCRGAVALALGCKEWDVQASPRPGGGFDLKLPKTYVPSRHDGKLAEVAEAIVGSPGWYFAANAKKLTGSIVPSEPPTFPDVLPYPMAELRRADWHFTPFGRALPAPGESLGPEVGIDWTSAAYMLLAGMPGSGKSVSLNDIIASQLANGAEMTILDVPAKAVDFLWCKKYCRPGGWGCDSLAAAVTALALVYEEGGRRSKVLAEAGVVNWLELPPAECFRPIFVVVDEVSGLLTTEKAPAGIPKDHPLVVEAVQHNLMVATLNKHINGIAAELRFVGVRMVLSTQVSNNSTGIGPSLKTKLGHKILQGSNPSETARKQAFNDPMAVPGVPDNVRADSKASKGVGAAELEGKAPVVYKSYYTAAARFAEALDALGVPTTRFPEPTPSQIARCTPSIDDSEPAGRSGTAGDDYGYSTGPVRNDDGEALLGAAAANHAHKVQMAQAEQQRKRAAQPAAGAAWELCTSCGTPVDPLAGCATCKS